MSIFIKELYGKIINKKAISQEEANQLFEVSEDDLFHFFSYANLIRRRFKGNKISLCAITNAKSGDCFEDCKFCAQSRHHNTGIAVYPLISVEEMLKRCDLAVAGGAHRFCLVTSGCSVDDKELDIICKGISEIKKKYPALKLDASLGKINYEKARRLKDTGLDRYNHNLETVPEFFAHICSTHTYKDRLSTIQILKKAKLEVCCGGIFGLGENRLQRAEFAFIIKELDIDSVAINFLNPIEGTAFAGKAPLEPLELIKIVAAFRFIMPDKEIRLCGGRQKNLRSLQSLAFCAGADATIIGDLLTTKGGLVKEDIQMFTDLGFTL
ncbi:MAG: biotin synthase BioB [Candidatus Omnitrophica bacterium]|nr:biotin synthase BioB [Candidatus Omnitrophota bacterium]